MDFDDHDEAEEEMGLSNYEPGLGNSGRDKPTVTAATTAGVSDPVNCKPAPGVRYRECLKNHAVSIGGHAVDGCGEFLPAGEEGSLDALRCAACSCHRNFHRKEVEGGGEPSPGSSAAAAAAAAGFHSPFSPYYRTPAGYLHHHHQHQYAAAAAAAAAAHHHHRPVPLALPSTSGGGHSREELDDVSNPMSFGFGGASGGPSSSSGKKRFRTKFSQEQKDKMLAFAEAVGWRLQKHDEAAVQQFCNEISVKRHVLKVWMHNNKHTLEVTSMEWEMIHMTDQEEDLIYRMINLIGHRWDLIAGRIPTRKPEEIERFVIMRERQGMMRRRECRRK